MGSRVSGVASGVGRAGKAVDGGGVGPQSSGVGTTIAVAKSSKTRVSVCAISPSLGIGGTLSLSIGGTLAIAVASGVGRTFFRKKYQPQGEKVQNRGILEK